MDQNLIKSSDKVAEKAAQTYGRNFSSAHEFYGVLMEEVDELWEEIKKKEKDYSYEAQRKEIADCVAVLSRYYDLIKKL